jgi:hypothetical protein
MLHVFSMNLVKLPARTPIRACTAGLLTPSLRRHFCKKNPFRLGDGPSVVSRRDVSVPCTDAEETSPTALYESSPHLDDARIRGARAHGWSFGPSYMQNIKQLRDGPRLCVVWLIFIPVCMTDSRRLETDPCLWVVHALRCGSVLQWQHVSAAVILS